MSAPLPRFDGADAWARLDPGVRDAIGRFAVEMLAAEAWTEKLAAAKPPPNEPEDVLALRQLIAAQTAALEQMRALADRALLRAGVDPVLPMLPWAAGRVCASCGEVEAGDPPRGWIGAERCERCPPEADPA